MTLRPSSIDVFGRLARRRRARREAAVARRIELDEELALHLELLERDELDHGSSPAAARTIAVARLGSHDAIASACERARTGTLIGALAMESMSTFARSARIAWNVALVAGMAFCLFVAWSARSRAIEASNLAAGTAMALGAEGVRPASLSAESQRAQLLRSIWGGDTAGTIEVRGEVNAPGTFATDVDHPLDLATLIERAGGAKPGARIVLWRFPEGLGEAATTIQSAQRFRGDHNTMPRPGCVITVR